jgi:preprotein translocase subunit SecB
MKTKLTRLTVAPLAALHVADTVTPPGNRNLPINPVQFAAMFTAVRAS